MKVHSNVIFGLTFSCPVPSILLLLFWSVLLAPLPMSAQSKSAELDPRVERLYSEAKQAQGRGDQGEAIAKYESILKIAREAVYSTGLGYGFATPHCKTDAVAADSICVLRLKEPINWDSVDGEQVRMVVLLALRIPRAPTITCKYFRHWLAS